MIQRSSLLLPVLLAVCLGCTVYVQATESEDVDNEINRLKKELIQVRQERQKAKDDAAKDKKEFADYQQRFSLRKNTLTSETDSVRRVAKSLETILDSLNGLAASLGVEKKQYELLQEQFKQRLASACNHLITTAKKLPPAVLKPCLGSLTFLLGDCSSKNGDNIEFLHRYVQIVQNIQEFSETIQTGQETAPISSQRGPMLMIRIGTVFEAVVDEEGKNGAVWLGNDESGQPFWKPITDPAQCAAIYKAINIRDSKALPEFVSLPYLSRQRTEAIR